MAIKSLFAASGERSGRGGGGVGEEDFNLCHSK